MNWSPDSLSDQRPEFLFLNLFIFFLIYCYTKPRSSTTFNEIEISSWTQVSKSKKHFIVLVLHLDMWAVNWKSMIWLYLFDPPSRPELIASRIFVIRFWIAFLSPKWKCQAGRSQSLKWLFFRDGSKLMNFGNAVIIFPVFPGARWSEIDSYDVAFAIKTRFRSGGWTRCYWKLCRLSFSHYITTRGIIWRELALCVCERCRLKVERGGTDLSWYIREWIACYSFLYGSWLLES